MHGGHNLHVHLCQLFNSMLIHCMSPSRLQSSTLVPIPKDKRKSLSLSDNYRTIALSSPICKVLDTVILRKYGDLLSNCDHQSSVTVHLHKESEKIRIKRGVRQGDTISPKLFTATLESIFRRLNWENK